MAKVDQAAPQKDVPVAKPDHTETIKDQVLEKTGKPPRLHHVEVCQLHHGNFRVNVWEKVQSTGDSAYSTDVRIASSYYLKVSDSGEILQSNPPLAQRSFKA